jgi:hypothetical protein
MDFPSFLILKDQFKITAQWYFKASIDATANRE